MTDTAWSPANRDRALFEAGECQHLHADPNEALAAGVFTMYDDVTASLIPTNAVAAAYYGNGPFANYGSVRARLPHAILAPTMLRAFTGDLHQINDWQHAVSWDCEPSLFSAQDAGNLVRLTRAQGVMPRLYFPLSWVTEVVASIAAAGFKRSDVMLHSAHWTFVPHICSGIVTSEWGTISMDSTQYTDRALNLSLDASLCAPHCLGPFGTSPKPKPQPKQRYASGQARAELIIDYEKHVGHRLSVQGTKGTWHQGTEQGLELMQVSFDKDGAWRVAGIPNNTKPLGS